jgi:hypothetical protein
MTAPDALERTPGATGLWIIALSREGPSPYRPVSDDSNAAVRWCRVGGAETSPDAGDPGRHPIQAMRWRPGRITLAMMKVYIRLADALGPRFARAFDDLDVRSETVLTGEVVDDAALHGLLARLRDLDVAMIDLRVEDRDSEPARGG